MAARACHPAARRVFSTASILNLLLGALVLRLPIERKVAIGALLGAIASASSTGARLRAQPMAGRIMRPSSACALRWRHAELPDRQQGFGFAQRRHLPIRSASAWGMLYGTLFLAALALLQGKPFIIDWSFSYIASLLYLVIASTVLAFAAYLTLLGARRSSPRRLCNRAVSSSRPRHLEPFRGLSLGAVRLCRPGFVAMGNLLVLRRRG